MSSTLEQLFPRLSHSRLYSDADAATFAQTLSLAESLFNNAGFKLPSPTRYRFVVSTVDFGRTNTRQADNGKRYMRVRMPLSIIRKGGPFLLYYVIHELCHVYVNSRRNYVRTESHGPKFYKVFSVVCPPELHHYEIAYKPTSVRYGVKAQ